MDDRTRSYFDLSGIRDADVANATLFVLTQHPATHRDIEQPLIDELHIRIYKFKNDAQIIAEPVVARSFKVCWNFFHLCFSSKCAQALIALITD